MTSSLSFSRRLAAFVKAYPVAAIESAVVVEFLAHHEKMTRNLLLCEVLAPIQVDPAAFTSVRAALVELVPDLDLDMALRIFEQAIPVGDRDLNGAIYTPRHIADFICARAIGDPAANAIDPSCGAGAFLLAIVRRLMDLNGSNGNLVPVGDIIEHQVIGRDILPYSIRHARILLALLACEAGDDRESFIDRLTVGDSLDPEWAAAIISGGGADVVVGNPPYVRFQELPISVREHLSAWQTTSAGNFNLYFAFFELGLHLLSADGTVPD